MKYVVHWRSPNGPHCVYAREWLPREGFHIFPLRCIPVSALYKICFKKCSMTEKQQSHGLFYFQICISLIFDRKGEVPEQLGES